MKSAPQGPNTDHRGHPAPALFSILLLVLTALLLLLLTTSSFPSRGEGFGKASSSLTSSFLPSPARGRGASSEGSSPSPWRRKCVWEKGLEGGGAGEAGSSRPSAGQGPCLKSYPPRPHRRSEMVP